MTGRIFSKVAMAAGLALAVGACAQGARVDAMSVHGTMLKAGLKSPYRQAIAIGKVTGGQDTNPLWVSKVGNPEFKTALRDSLQANGLLATKPGRARYRLNANLVTLDQPAIGLNMTVKTSVKYTLLRTRTERPVYDEIISNAYTAKFGQSLLGVERLRLANEGAIRNNIKSFLADLLKKVSPGMRTGS